ncbi:hypothetical protein [Kiloniella sp.]|uniref:hypothetical protein n=1 Tax=Kiloniella sp. TaxID=1938587 RepID=UPI003B02C464
MGIIANSGSNDRAPKWSSNGTDKPIWSGLSSDQIDHSLAFKIQQFCIEEGYRSGWDDSNNDRLEFETTSLFHPSFLDGYPHYLWMENYVKAANENSEFRGVSIRYVMDATYYVNEEDIREELSEAEIGAQQ